MMSTQITIRLPEDILKRAELLSMRTGRAVADVLSDAITLSLNPLGDRLEDERPLTSWTDKEVLAAAELQLPEADDERLSELLNRQQAGQLNDTDRPELTALMQRYQQGLLRKAVGLREAVRRGLCEALDP